MKNLIKKTITMMTIVASLSSSNIGYSLAGGGGYLKAAGSLDAIMTVEVSVLNLRELVHPSSNIATAMSFAANAYKEVGARTRSNLVVLLNRRVKDTSLTTAQVAAIKNCVSLVYAAQAENYTNADINKKVSINGLVSALRYVYHPAYGAYYWTVEIDPISCTTPST